MSRACWTPVASELLPQPFSSYLDWKTCHWLAAAKTKECCENTQFYFSLELFICFRGLSIPTRPHLFYVSLFADTGLCSPVRWQLILVPAFWGDGGGWGLGGGCLLCSSWSEGQHWGLGVRRRLWDTNHSGVPDLLAFWQWRLVMLRALFQHPACLTPDSRGCLGWGGGGGGPQIESKVSSSWSSHSHASPCWLLIHCGGASGFEHRHFVSSSHRRLYITQATWQLLFSFLSFLVFDDCCFTPVYKGRIREDCMIACAKQDVVWLKINKN